VFALDRYEYFEDVNLGLVGQAPEGARILDVGCGSGLLGSVLRERGNEVWGIDSASEVSGKASARLDRFAVADLTDLDAVRSVLADETFDVVMFADVLEHLYDPIGVLRSYTEFLRPDGAVLISVPNVALWWSRFALLAGRFPYRDTGTLDKTHIRFFTKANLLRALTDAGLEPLRLDVTPGLARPFVPLVKSLLGDSGDRGSIVQSRPYRLYTRWLYPFERRVARLAPGLLAFQYIAVARPSAHARQGSRALAIDGGQADETAADHAPEGP
jgi:2-polyprenyl-3-methyl-5-hydroxy-6-metoxy-1,4-benzoquinol methylase